MPHEVAMDSGRLTNGAFDLTLGRVAYATDNQLLDLPTMLGKCKKYRCYLHSNSTIACILSVDVLSWGSTAVFTGR